MPIFLLACSNLHTIDVHLVFDTLVLAVVALGLRHFFPRTVLCCK